MSIVAKCAAPFCRFLFHMFSLEFLRGRGGGVGLGLHLRRVVIMALLVNHSSVYGKFCFHLYYSCVQIQEEIAAHTDIPANKQLIVTFRHPLTDIVGERTKIESFPKTILKNHIFVFEKENYENRKMKDPETRKCF